MPFTFLWLYTQFYELSNILNLAKQQFHMEFAKGEVCEINNDPLIK